MRGGGPGTTFLFPLSPPSLCRLGFTLKCGPARNNISIAQSPSGSRPTRAARPTVERKASCSPAAFNDIKQLARSMPADGLEAQDVVPPRRGCWVARKAIFSSRRLVFARSRAPSLAALPVITWRLRLVTVMAGLWSVVAEAVVRACLTVLVSFECSCGV